MDQQPHRTGDWEDEDARSNGAWLQDLVWYGQWADGGRGGRGIDTLLENRNEYSSLNLSLFHQPTLGQIPLPNQFALYKKTIL